LRSSVNVPHEIMLPFAIEDAQALGELLSERLGRNVQVRVPQRGDARQLVEMAQKNAEQGFLEKQKTEEHAQELLSRLMKRLGLSRTPSRIECVDNSHMQGRYPVSAIVVFEEGLPNRYEYRRYHLKEAKGGDDFAGMKEILTRRFKRGIKENNLPELMVIDGGRAQLQMALAALEELGLDAVEVVAIAKKRATQAAAKGRAELMEDRILVPGRKNSIPVRSPHRELLILSQIRDEAHRTAVEFHRKTREREKLKSVLEHIPSVGSQRKKALLQALKSPQRIAEASLEELCAIPGIPRSVAEEIRKYFHQNPLGS
ncbi:MAG: helix-hairpin-helix domain-containing protein, partial [Myxococcota bacterium]